MSENYRVDTDVLEQLARSLQDGGSAMESVGETLPAAPDGGAATAAMIAAVARVVLSTGALVEGMGAAAEAVRANAASYQGQETAESDRFRSLAD